jgi:hypothetical protein
MSLRIMAVRCACSRLRTTNVFPLTSERSASTAGALWVDEPASDKLWVTARDGDVVLTTTGNGTFTHAGVKRTYRRGSIDARDFAQIWLHVVNQPLASPHPGSRPCANSPAAEVVVDQAHDPATRRQPG